MKATLARFKAAKLLGFSGDNHYLSQSWPESLNSNVVIELQGNNEISVDLIKAAINGGKIPKHYEETNYMACLNPTIAACDFIALLKEIGEEPSDSIKAWFESTTPQAVGDDGACGQVTAPISPKAIKANGNELNFSGLLNAPAKKDDWFSVIDDMTRAYHSVHSTIPNNTQAWVMLCTNPPDGYEIKYNEGDIFITMLGKKLTKVDFDKRWKNYTK